MHKTKIRSYNCWKCMIARCTIPTAISYPNYGARGIRVCERWLDFAVFHEDMGERPPNTTLDRIDNDGNYEPSNCRWATRKEQQANRRPQRKLHNRFVSPGSIRKIGNRFNIDAHLPGGYHWESFATEEEALDCKSLLTFEREMHRALGL